MKVGFHTAKLQSVLVVRTLLDWLKGTTLRGMDDRQRPGRERITTRQQDRYIVLTHLRDRFRTSVETAQERVGTHNLRVSALTVRRRLQKRDISSHKTYRGNVLTANVESVALIGVDSASDGHNSVGVVYCSRTSPVFVLKCLIGRVKYGVDVGSDFKTVVLNRCHVGVVVA